MAPAAIPGNYMPGTAYATIDSPASSASTGGGSTAKAQVVDGTPARVASMAVLALGVVVGLRWSGFKFNVAVRN